MKYLPLIAISALFSCQTQDIEGTWIGHYHQVDLKGLSKQYPLNTVINIEKNEFYNQVLTKKGTVDSFEFFRRGNKIIPRIKTHPGFVIVSVSEDSLVLTMPQMEMSSLVYKKYENRKPIKHLDMAGMSYKVSKTDSIYKFVADSTLIRNSQKIGIWSIRSIFSTEILELNDGDKSQFYTVDSVQNKMIYLTNYSMGINEIVLERI